MLFYSNLSTSQIFIQITLFIVTIIFKCIIIMVLWNNYLVKYVSVLNPINSIKDILIMMILMTLYQTTFESTYDEINI